VDAPSRNGDDDGASNSKGEESGLEDGSGSEKSRVDLGLGGNKEVEEASDAPRASQYQDLAG